MKRHVKIEPYWGPVGGWGSARAVSDILLREGRPIEGPITLAEQNKPSGFACVSCSYAKPGQPKFLEFCENGAKATAWEITSKRCGPDFFAAHTLTELEKWSDHSLEEVGRLTEPMRYTKRPTNIARSNGKTPSHKSGRLFEASILHQSFSTRPAVRRLKPRTCISYLRACTDQTISPIAQTCATRARPSRFPRRSVCRSAQSSLRTFHTPTACSSLDKMSG